MDPAARGDEFFPGKGDAAAVWRVIVDTMKATHNRERAAYMVVSLSNAWGVLELYPSPQVRPFLLPLAISQNKKKLPLPFPAGDQLMPGQVREGRWLLTVYLRLLLMSGLDIPSICMRPLFTDL